MDRFLHVTAKIKTKVIFVSCRIFPNLFRTRTREIPWQNGNWFCKMWEWTTAHWNMWCKAGDTALGFLPLQPPPRHVATQMAAKNPLHYGEQARRPRQLCCHLKAEGLHVPAIPPLCTAGLCSSAGTHGSGMALEIHLPFIAWSPVWLQLFHPTRDANTARTQLRHSSRLFLQVTPHILRDGPWHLDFRGSFQSRSQTNEPLSGSLIYINWISPAESSMLPPHPCSQTEDLVSVGSCLSHGC